MAAQEPINVSLDLLVEPNPLFGAIEGIPLPRFMELDQNISYSTPDNILNDILDKPLITTGMELDQNISYSTPDSNLNDILDKPLDTTGIIFIFKSASTFNAWIIDVFLYVVFLTISIMLSFNIQQN